MAGVRVGIRPELDSQGMRSVEMQFNKMMSRLSGRQANFSVNSKSFTQPLGRITSSANEFTKSLEASNARVIAFGASVGIINAVANSFKALVAETIKFEKTLMDINVIMGSSQQSIEAFGFALFDTAKNTGQSFNQVAEAALEFSRQGLSMEETLRRTNDALILTRLTSLKAEEAVSGLTAAVNAFGDTGVNTTDIIDKLAAVDVNFAVSSEDLINALERTGAVAIDAGVKLDNLIGIVTSLQQTTARGGSVIGNGLKTIFTRIRRPESIRQLEEMGVQVKNLQGNLLPADKVLQNIAKSFDHLTDSQQSNITQFAAGIFQANIFKSALRDLAKEQNIFEQATSIAGDAMGDASIKNEQLNKTLDALAKKTTVSIEEMAEVIGNLTLKGPIGGILENVEAAASGISNALGGGEEAGNTFFTGFVKGIGNVLSGPGLVAFTAVMGKMLLSVGKFASQSLKDVLGVVGRKEKLVQMETSIINALAQNKQIQEGLNELEGDRLAQEKFMLKVLEAQTHAMMKQKHLASSLAGSLLNAGVNPDLTVSDSGPLNLSGDNASKGLIPQSAKQKERKGAIEGGYTPGGISSMSISGIGKVVYNKAETVKQFPGMSQPAIMPPRTSRAGKNYEKQFSKKHGFDPYAFKGYIPNFTTINNNLTSGSQAMELRGLQTGGFKLKAQKDALRKVIEQNPEVADTGIDIEFSTPTNKLKGTSFKATGGDKSKLSLGEYLEALGVHEVESKIPFGYIDDIPRNTRRPKVYNKKVIDNLNKGSNDHKGNVGESLFLNSKEAEGYKSTGGVQATDEYGNFTIDKTKGKSNFVVDAIKPGDIPFEIKAGEIDLDNIASKSIRRYSNFSFRDQVSQLANDYVGDTNPNSKIKGLTNGDVASELNWMIGKLEEDLLVESLAQLTRMGSWTPVGMSKQEVSGLLGKQQLQKTLRERPELIDEAAKDIVISHGISSGFVPNYAEKKDVYNKDGRTLNARNEYTLPNGNIFTPDKGQMIPSGGMVNGQLLDDAGELTSTSIPVDNLLDPKTKIRPGFPMTQSKKGSNFQEKFGERAYMGDPGNPTDRFDWTKPTEGDVLLGEGNYDPNAGINEFVIQNTKYGEAASSSLSHTSKKMLAKANNTPGVRSGLEFYIDNDGGASILDVVFPQNSAEFINKKGLDGYEMIGSKINLKRNNDADVSDVANFGLSKLGGRRSVDWIRPSIFRDYVNAMDGIVPNYNALNLKSGYFSEREVESAIQKVYKNKTGSTAKLNSVDVNKYKQRYIAAIQDAQSDDPEGYVTSYTSGQGKLNGQNILFNEVSLALEKAGNYYQPKEGETVEDFSKGIVPNFENVTLKRGQPNVMSGGEVSSPQLKEPDINQFLFKPFLSAQTPQDVSRISESFMQAHATGVLSGRSSAGTTGSIGSELEKYISTSMYDSSGNYETWIDSKDPYSDKWISPDLKNEIGSNFTDIASGAVSYTTRSDIANEFSKTKLKTGPGGKFEKNEGTVHETVVPKKNIFGKNKIEKMLSMGAKPPKYPMVDKFKSSIKDGSFFDYWKNNGGLFVNIDGQRNDKSLVGLEDDLGKRRGSLYNSKMDSISPEVGREPGQYYREGEVTRIANKGFVPNFANNRVARARKGLKSDTKNYLKVSPSEYDQFEDLVGWMQAEFPVSGLRLDKDTFSISANTEDIRHIKSVMDNPSVIRNMKKDGIEQPSALLKSFLSRHTQAMLEAKNFERKGVSEGVTANTALRGYFKGDSDKYYDVASQGLVPNFNDPLTEAIKREKAAGIPSSRIRVETSGQLKGKKNPLGLAVTNTIDEPMGINQGIRRAKSMRIDPKTHGMSVPNFAGLRRGGARNTNPNQPGPTPGPMPSTPKPLSPESLQELASLEDQAKKLADGLAFLSSKVPTERFDKASKSLDAFNQSLDDVKNEIKTTGSSSSMTSPEFQGSLSNARTEIFEAFESAEVNSSGQDRSKVVSEGDKVSEAFGKISEKSGRAQAILDKENKSRDNGLQRLFFFQSMISMTNGFLSEFAETTQGTTKNMAELAMGASSVFAAYMQQKELIPEISEALGAKSDESVGLGSILPGEGRDRRLAATRTGEREARARNLQRQGRGGVGGAVARFQGGGIGKALGGLARGFVRFLPLVGQLYTGFTALNEAFKYFTGESIFEKLSGSADRARRQIEELGKTSETVSAALEAMKSKEEIQQKMVDLEILGGSRTQKQEQDYYDLRLKSLDVDAKLAASMNDLYDENKVGELGLQAVNKALGGSTEAHGENKKAMQDLMVVTKMLTAAQSNIVNFAEGVDRADSEGNSEKLMKLSEAEGTRSAFTMKDLLTGSRDNSPAQRDEALNKNIIELKKLAANPEMDIDDLNFDANELVGNEGIKSLFTAKRDATDEFEYDTGGLSDDEAKAFAMQISTLAEKLKKTDISEGQKAIMMADTKFAKELGKLISLSKLRISQEKILSGHQIELSKAKRKEIAASEDMLSEYGLMSTSSAAINKASREAANQLDEINKKRKDAEDELSTALLSQAGEMMNTNMLSPDLKREGDDLSESISEFNKRLTKAGNANFEFKEFNSRVLTDLNIDDELKSGVAKIFEGISVDEGTEFQEQLNEIAKRISDAHDPRVKLAALLAAKESGILAVSEETLEKLAQASEKYSQSLLSLDLQVKRQEESNKQTLKKLLIDQKTLKGSVLLEKELSQAILNQQVITENLQGQAGTLQVINKFASKRLKLEQGSVAFQSVIFENLRKQAIESAKSGMEGLSSSQQRNSLQSSAPSKNQEVLDTQRLLMQIQLTKIGEDKASAESAAIEAEIRRGYLSDLTMLGAIVESEISAEADNLAIEVQKKVLKLANLDSNAKSLELIKSTVQGEMIDLVTANKTSAIRRNIMDQMGYRSIIADQQNDQELNDLKDGNKLEKEKLQRLIISGKINEIVSEQVQQEILSSERGSLINAKKELLLSLNTEMADRMRDALSLEETGNKLKALRNAKEQAMMDQSNLNLMVGADVQTDKFQQISNVRETATRATLTDDPDDILAFAEAYKEYNKEIGNNSEIVDALKVKMAEMNVEASNLKSDLVNLGIDSARSGLKGAFKDIATGAKDIGEAFADVGLGIASTIMDRIMDSNIDNIIKDLTFAFTGESAKSDAQIVVDSNTELGTKLEQSSSVEQELSSKLESLVGKVEAGLTKGVQLTNTEKLIANLKKELADAAGEAAENFASKFKELFGDKPEWVSAIAGLGEPMGKLKTSLDDLKGAIEKKLTEEAPSSSSKDKVEAVRKDAEKKANEVNKPKSQDQINSISLKNKADPFKQSYKENPYVNPAMQRRSMVDRDLDVSRYNDEKMFEITRNKNIDIGRSKLGLVRGDKDHAQEMVSHSQKTISSFQSPLYENKGMFLGGNQLVRPKGKNFDEFSSLSKSKNYAQSNFDEQQNKVNDLRLNSDLTNSEDKEEYDNAVQKLQMFKGELTAAEDALRPLASELARATEQLKLYSNKLSEAKSTEKVVQKEVNDFVASDKAVPSGYERPAMGQPATISEANPQGPVSTAGAPELSKLMQDDNIKKQEFNTQVGKIASETKGIKTEIAKVPQAIKTGLSSINTKSPAEMMTGGKVKKYAKGGLVSGPGGIDNVPAMLTAGEYVIPKDVVSKFKEGGKASWSDRLQAGAQGVANTAASTYGSYAASRSAEKAEEEGPPEFDMKKLKSMDLGFDVSMDANDKMVSNRLSQSHAGSQEYGQHLLDLHDYNVAKKNEKFEKRMGTFNQIMGMVGGFVTSGIMNAGTTLAKAGIGKVKDAFKPKEEKMLDQFKADATDHAVGREVDDFIGDLYGDKKKAKSSKHTVTSTFNDKNKKTSVKKQGIDKNNLRALRGYNKGGSVVPAMLTAGESFIPSSVAKKIGYANLEKLNVSGEMPIIQGQAGIDKVGPVGLGEGDFIVKKSSTDKLMQKNPNTFKMAMQNPEGFKKSINNYYQGGVVSNNRLPSSSSQAPSAPQAPQVQPAQLAPLPEAPAGDGGQSSSTSNVTNNISVNVSIDESGKETSSESGETKGAASERDLSKKIKSAVLEVIRQEKRVGGEFS